MRIRITIIALLTLSCHGIFGQELKKEYQKVVLEFIDCVKYGKNEKIANMISYPLEREYPVPEIKNKQEFIKRYNDIFDDGLKQMIIKSNLATDWSDMGWRGIMLNDGVVWLDFDGHLVAINYQSNYERNLKAKLIEADKKNIHSSLSNYETPVCILETSKYRIRIDDLGKEKFRYACWAINKSQKYKPDLVLQSGQVILEGSGGNHSYKFENAGYTYECSIIETGQENDPPAMLTVYKGDKEILSQSARIIKNENLSKLYDE
ncbi:MAG: hypothetical protein WCM93_03905 [Bacteroidota bacterium]